MSSIFLLEIVLIHLHSSIVDPMLSDGWLLYLLSATCIYPMLSLMGAHPFISPRTVHSRRVPSLGGYDADGSRRHYIVVLLIGCFSGIVFSGIHCLGWNVLSPSQGVAMWRAACLVMVSAPVCIILMFSYLIWLNGEKFYRDDLRDGEVVSQLIILWNLAIYIIGRISLIVLILGNFRSLPPGVYDSVAWTEFIPHL
jgi:hypothetical protein